MHCDQLAPCKHANKQVSNLYSMLAVNNLKCAQCTSRTRSENVFLIFCFKLPRCSIVATVTHTQSLPIVVIAAPQTSSQHAALALATYTPH